MVKFACLPSFSVVKKKKSKGISKAADGSKKGSSKGDLRVKPTDLFSTSPENGLKENHLTFSNSFPSVEKAISITTMVLSDDSFARAEPTGEADYEGGDEHSEIQSMKRDYSDLDLQPKGELASHGSNTDLNNYVFEKMETNKEIVAEEMMASGHVSDPGMELTVSLGPPVLKRSCSNIENRHAKQWINSLKRSSSYSSLQNLSGNGRVEMISETYSSPLSARTSCSADRVMLKRWPSSQVLPSRSKKVWWKLFLRSHSNLHKPQASRKLVSVLGVPNLKSGYTSDDHELCQKPNKWKKTVVPENQWPAFSLKSSQVDRFNAWVNGLNDCSFIPVTVEEDSDGFENEQTADLQNLETVASSEKPCSNTNRRVAEEVAQANNIIKSLNTFSTVAHIPGSGLKVIPSISAFACLRTVNLSGNCIVNITPGSLPKSLHTLDLSRNNISTIEGLGNLERLRVLNLSYNRIAKISHGLSSCTLIKELYLGGNKISNVEGLHRLLKLTVLDLSFNKIITVKGLGQLVANYNSLLALNLLGNPILASIGDDQLRKAVLSLLPHVTYLNKQPIKPHKVREVVSEKVTKAALGDAAGSSKRKLTKRLSHGSGSLPKSKVTETSKHGKSRHSTSGNKFI
ncbi:hypothetical protein IEQ34_010831 [Dendrobium chrysotoxum]|uniref:Uncharacterized protein n=1 Tax=Dendrobium chrysotoxum TaxID=161865 RepID=A0AAV7GWZ7_DENCH|nr:hypothetical protein IEQ34_010831 [Dendrobium chrysotoxum]